LFDNLLDISKLDAGQVEARRELVSVNTLFDRLRSAFAESAQDKGLTFRLRRSKVMLASDETLLYRVLSNLVANALRYTEEGGVLVACRKRGSHVSIEVWDTGIGIPAEQHERIFEEFYQLNNPSRDRTRGLGLGLATVKRIARCRSVRFPAEARVSRSKSRSPRRRECRLFPRRSNRKFRISSAASSSS